MTAAEIIRCDLDAAAARIAPERSIWLAERAGVTDRVMGCGHRILDRSDTGRNPGRHVAAMGRFIAEFAPLETVDLDGAIARTAHWNGW